MEAVCKLPTTFATPQQKVATLDFADPGKGEGCDLTGDGKPDNVLYKLKSLAGTQLTDALKKGSLVLVTEAVNFDSTGKPFTLNMYAGDVDEANKDCDVIGAEANCKYTVSPNSFDKTSTDATCPALIKFKNATDSGGTLAAGGPTDIFALTIPVQGVVLDIVVQQATVQGTIVGDPWGKTDAGLICGVITQQALKDAIQKIPDSVWAGLPIGKDAALTLVNTMLKPDISTKNDGNKDGISVGLKFTTVPGQITTVK